MPTVRTDSAPEVGGNGGGPGSPGVGNKLETRKVRVSVVGFSLERGFPSTMGFRDFGLRVIRASAEVNVAPDRYT